MAECAGGERGDQRLPRGENRQDLRAALPELTTVAEAVSLATMEWRLTPPQQAKLRQLLELGLKATSAPPSAQQPA